MHLLPPAALPAPVHQASSWLLPLLHQVPLSATAAAAAAGNPVAGAAAAVSYAAAADGDAHALQQLQPGTVPLVVAQLHKHNKSVLLQ
jgi:hypothetical protein